LAKSNRVSCDGNRSPEATRYAPWVRREDERADALRRLGAEVVQGDLTDLTSMHRAIEGCARIYFGM
jgi:hypothetical protein